MKKFLIVSVIIFISSLIIAANDSSLQITGTASADTAISTATATLPVYVGKLGIGYNGTLNFRFWPSESMGYEIPIYGTMSGNFKDPTSTFYTPNWTIYSGINFLLPVKNNFGISVYIEPGIILGADDRFIEYFNTDGSNRQDYYNYDFIAGVNIGLEAEVFLNRFYDKLPSNISIASKVQLIGKITLNEQWYKNYDLNVTNNFTRSVSYSLGTANSGATLMDITIRYYF